MQSTLNTFLSKQPPFNKLPAQEISRLISASQEKTHGKGEFIFSEGEEASSVWILKKGRLDIFKYTSEGKPYALETISPGELFGTLCRLGGSDRSYPCTAVAAQDSISIRIPEKLFMEMFYKYPALVTGVCTLCSERLNQMKDLTCTTQEPVDKRIAKTLISLSSKYGNSLPMTKKEIAELSATTVETTIRTMSKFQKNKWISSTRGNITLENPKKLKSVFA